MRIALRLLLFLITFIAVSVCVNAVATNISTCSYNISFPGEYTLNQTINSTGESCINITTSNVTLDCKGLWMNGSISNTGIFVNASNITIQNCNITGFNRTIGAYNSANIAVINTTLEGNNVAFGSNYGIYFSNVLYSSVINSTARKYLTNGIYFFSVNYSNITNCTSYANTALITTVAGITLEASSNNILANNTLYRNQLGIYLLSSSKGNTIIDNKVDYNAYYGMALDGNCSNNKIINNTANNQTQVADHFGIYLQQNSSYNNLTLNTVQTNTYGIQITLYSMGNIVDKNRASNNTYALRIDTSSNSSNITNNVFSNNTRGIYLDESSSNTIINNTVTNNTNSGVYMSASSNNTLANNTLSRNSPYGIDLLGASNANTIIDNKVDYNWQVGISIRDSDYNKIINNTVNNQTDDPPNTIGIFLANSDYNNLSSNTAQHNTYGIYLVTIATGNIIDRNLQISNNTYGLVIYNVGGSSNANNVTNNKLINNTFGMSISECTNNRVQDNIFDSENISVTFITAPSNKFYNNTLLSILPTTVSFDAYSGNLNITEVSSYPSALPKKNIGKFVNISGTDSVNITMNYSDSDIASANVDEATLGIYHYTAGAWSLVPGGGISTADNLVWANLTSFSEFGVLGSSSSTITGGMNISLTKTGSPNPVTAGNTLTYTISVTISNLSERTNISNLTLTDIYPADVIFVSSQPTNLSGTNNTFILGNISDNRTIQVNITVTVLSTAGGTVINNTANISFFNSTFTYYNLSVTGSTTVNSVAPTPVQSGGGGGGGGGGGYNPFNRTNTTTASCFESWTCDSWSECVNTKQIRSCSDLRGCGTTKLKPAEERDCVYTPKPAEPVPEPAAEETAPAPETNQGILSLPGESPMPSLEKIFYGLAVLALIGLLVYLGIMHKRSKQN